MPGLEGQHRFSAVRTPQLTTHNPALDYPHLALSFSIPMWIIDGLVFTGCQQMINSNIDPYFSARGRKGLFFHLTSKTGIPFPGLSTNTNGLDPALQWSMPSYAYTTNPAKPQPPSIQLETVTIFF